MSSQYPINKKYLDSIVSDLERAVNPSMNLLQMQRRTEQMLATMKAMSDTLNVMVTTINKQSDMINALRTEMDSLVAKQSNNAGKE